jgi:hypothetical protein
MNGDQRTLITWKGDTKVHTGNTTTNSREAKVKKEKEYIDGKSSTSSPDKSSGASSKTTGADPTKSVLYVGSPANIAFNSTYPNFGSLSPKQKLLSTPMVYVNPLENPFTKKSGG